MVKLFAPSKQIACYLDNLVYLHDHYWAWTLAKKMIWARDGFSLQPNGTLLFTHFRLSLEKNRNFSLLDGYKSALALADNLGANFTSDFDHNIIVEVEGRRVRINHEEDLFILDEIFVQGIYNFSYSSPSVIWDIGMNVGIAALFFAGLGDVQVVGYEPFLENFQVAMANFSLNPELSRKIHPINSGVGESSVITSASYNPSAHGSSGLFKTSFRSPDFNRTKIRNVEIIEAPYVLQKIIDDFPNRSIVLKMDCEGSEYQIVKALSRAGMLRLLTGMMVEWHRKEPEHDPGQLVSILLDSGFLTFAFDTYAPSNGMIYAVRTA
jgi:FkbM family methyltransferase